MNRLDTSSGAKWEQMVGYSRAVRIGNIIEVAETRTLFPVSHFFFGFLRIPAASLPPLFFELSALFRGHPR